MRILIADDEIMARKLLQKTLERAGFEVTAVENGRQAAEQLCPADAALYAAKAAGRNCVKVASPNTPSVDTDSQAHEPVRLQR